MDRDRPTRDARAVEDPIAAIFDLAESVDRETPKIRKMLRYVRVFVSLWLLLDVFLIIALAMRRMSGSTARLVVLILVIIFASLQILSIGGPLFVFGIAFVALFVLGFIILELMQDLRSFFDFFALRHRVIQRVREADPVVYVPQGKDAVQRILSYLGATSPDVHGVMAVPNSVAIPALLTGQSGLTYSFDAYVRQPPSLLWRTTTLGSVGFAIYVKSFDQAPTLGDLQALKRAVEDVSLASRIPPARILVLWRAKGEESIPTDVYEFLTKESVRVRIRGSTFACSLELAMERDDGTYDFIPLVVEPAFVPGASPSTA